MSFTIATGESILGATAGLTGEVPIVVIWVRFPLI